MDERKIVAGRLVFMASGLKAGTDYRHDPDHRHKPDGAGWEKTPKGWTKKKHDQPAMPPQERHFESEHERRAADPGASQKELDAYSRNSSVKVREAVSRNPATSEKTLDDLAMDLSYLSRLGVARHQNASKEALEMLAIDDFEEVADAARKNLAGRGTPLREFSPEEKKLIGLSQSHDAEDRRKAAEKAGKFDELLNKLGGDDKKEVRAEVARNEHAPRRIQERLAKDKENIVRVNLAETTGHEDLLSDLSKDIYWGVRMAVAGNQKAPTGLLKKLAEDEESAVSRKAEKTLEGRGE